MDNSPDCLKLLNEGGRIVWINERGCRLLGITDPGVVNGAVWQTLWPPDVRPMITAALKTARAGGVGRFTGRCATFAGVWKWWDVAVVALDVADESPKLLVMSRDVTALMGMVETERALAIEAAVARDEAERARRSQEQVLAVLAHDLRAPLQVVLSWAVLLQSAGPGDLSAAALGRRIEAATIDQLQLVERLLSDHSSVALDKAERFASLHLSRVVADGAETLRPLVAAKGLTLAIRGATSRTDLILGDRLVLRQMVLNVLANAVKYTQAGGRISLTTSVSAYHCTLTCRDTGVGIAPDALRRLTDECRRPPAGNRSRGSFGLGLRIVRRAIEAHAGRLVVCSPGVGRGTTVSLRFPRAGRFFSIDGRARGA